MEKSMSDAGAYGLLFLDAITVDVTNLDYVLVIEIIQEIICRSFPYLSHTRRFYIFGCVFNFLGRCIGHHSNFLLYVLP